MSFDIRPFHPSDLPALYRICLLTGDNGDDATLKYSDPELLGHYFAAPYAVFEPELCFILTHEGQPVGYVLGCLDSAEFYQKCEREWFPTLRARYPKPAEDDQRWTASDRNLINEIHRGTAPEKGLEAYPAHLHIDLLPIGQKKGWGRKLMHTFWDKLRDLSASAVHLGVSVNNANAVAFYYHIGYHKIEGGEFGLMLGKHL